MKKILLIACLVSGVAQAQVSFPHGANGVSGSERVANFTVSDAGNDRLEIANGTLNGGQFIPTIWSYRDTSNSFSMVLTSAISPGLDSGTSPLMLFTTGVTTQLDLNAPNSGNFVWGPSGSTGSIINRPVFQWRNASARLVTILANGNTGIGTEDPTAVLHTFGSVRFQNLGGATNPNFMLGTDGNGNVFEYPVPTGTGGTSDADFLKPDGTVPMDINDDIYTNGFTGFNVQNPLSVIHSNGTVRHENLPNATTPAFLLGTDASGNVAEYPALAGTDADFLKPDGTVPTDINDNIYTNGFTGFNVQNPSSVIHSKGSVRFEDLPNEITPAFFIGTDANGNVAEYPVPVASGGSVDADWLKPDGSVPMDIDDDIYTNGFTGFNVQNPSSVIHSNGTVRHENLPNGTAPVFLLGTDASGNVAEYPAVAGGDADFLKPDGTVPMDINDNIYTNGFTGFNVQNPQATIHANGAVRLENLANATAPTFMLGTDAIGNVFEYPVPITGSPADADWLRPDGSIATDIDQNIYTNGKVGINTNIYPTHVGSEDVSFYNLFVTGGILTEEVRVSKVSEWADYVFKKGYKLPTLQEVEKHIEDEGHLINIPSAAEVKENGIELAEMNKKLLEKVEELTLYVIDLNKKMEAQQKEIEQLKANKK